jgi:hypothetical protein
MENSARNPSEKAASARQIECAEADPILLALPPRRMDEVTSAEPCLEQLHAIETGSGPKVEMALLLELLKESPGLEQSLVDPTEVHNYHNPLASINAYKQRLHAIRCEYVDLRMRLEAELGQVRASRMWRVANEFNRWRQILRQYFGWFRKGGDAQQRKPAA